MIPARFAPLLSGFLMSLMMSSIVSGISTLRVGGADDGFAAAWLTAWAYSWTVAFPVVLVVAPLVRRIVAVAIRPPDAA
ncbi:DUF2798 domain-containing protein [Leisingera sp. SS27]|uniref:DUF2798 domain-containing protein n=1 Tax=Leisingera sp. SS27 TaxID=2979462 RepID=UPI00232BDB09|nr:DUF2798 domain-containing protein [Leisingera sp. SS27]MDC0658890.1 DUF2798 domain-containing protein [Leisingera sp. SS27]